MVYLVTYHNSECQKHRSMCSPSYLVIQGNLHPVQIGRSRLNHFKDLKIWVSSVFIVENLANCVSVNNTNLEWSGASR